MNAQTSKLGQSKPVVNALSTRHGFLRLDSILAPLGPLPISRSSWWNKVRSGTLDRVPWSGVAGFHSHR